MKIMGEAMGEDNPDAVKDMEAKFEAKRPEMMAKCEELVKSNPDAEKALDCIIAAADFDAMALHARTLGFAHPVTGETLRFEEPLPDELATWLDAQRRDLGSP